MLKYNLCIIYASGYSWGLLHFFEQYWGQSGTKGTFNLLTYHRSRPFLHPSHHTLLQDYSIYVYHPVN
jgi:hypothetical protein